MKDVTSLLPAYNEEKSIEKPLKSIKENFPKSEIIVVDNNSIDKTAHISKKYASKVLYERKQGKAHAIKKGLGHIKSNYTIMLDADNTYDPYESKKLIKPLKENKADVTLGSRLNGNKEEGSITKFNLFGNHILSLTASLLYSKISDLCTGYWAFHKDVVDFIVEDGIKSEGFELEGELFVKIYNNNFKVVEVPIIYKSRIDQPKLKSIEDGWKIFKTLWIYRIKSKIKGNNKISKYSRDSWN